MDSAQNSSVSGDVASCNPEAPCVHDENQCQQTLPVTPASAEAHQQLHVDELLISNIKQEKLDTCEETLEGCSQTRPDPCSSQKTILTVKQESCLEAAESDKTPSTWDQNLGDSSQSCQDPYSPQKTVTVKHERHLDEIAVEMRQDSTEEDSSSSTSSSSSSSSEDSDSEDDSSSSDSSSSSSDENITANQSYLSDSEDDHPSTLLLPPKTHKELLVQDLPPVEPVDIVLDAGEELKPVGAVSSIIGQIVVVQSDIGVAALDSETVLFREDKQAIGVVFEVFGPVSCPFYTVRFNSVNEIQTLKIELKMHVFFAPRIPDITTYVFTQQLRQLKGSDASWEHDEEPPKECLEYSDDEKERSAKNKKKADKRKRKMPNNRRDNGQDVPIATNGNQQTRQASNNYQGFHGPRNEWGMRPRPPFQSSRGRGMPRPTMGQFGHQGPRMDQFRPQWHPQAYQQQGSSFNPNPQWRSAGNPWGQSSHGNNFGDWRCDVQNSYPSFPPPPPPPPPPFYPNMHNPAPPPPPPPPPPPNSMTRPYFPPSW